MTDQKITDHQDFIGWLANEWRGGCLQAVCSEAQLEAGEHYTQARIVASEASDEIITKYHLDRK